MSKFSPTRKERRALREWIEHLDLLDLLTGKLSPALSSQHDTSAPTEERRPLYLAQNFAIGYYSARPAQSLSTARPLIEQVLTSIYERSWLNHMMSTINKPLALDLGPTDYYNGIAETIADAALARVAILHLTDPDSVASTIDAPPVTGIYDREGILESFSAEISLRKSRDIYRVFLDNPIGEENELLRLGGVYGNGEEIINYIGDKDIKTLLIIPLSLGGMPRGYLSIGFNVIIGLSDTLELAFHNMGSHSLAATENYRRIRALDDLRNELMQKHLAGTQVELLQGFRHVAGGALANATYAFGKVSAARDQRNKGADVYYTDLQDALGSISDALKQMRSIRKVGIGLEEVDVLDVFDDAVQLTDYQLKRENISVRRDKAGSMRVLAHETALRYALSNLLLNSVQAFQDGSQKQNRTITLVGRESDRDIVLDYSDSGPGLRLGRGNIREANDIWKPGATSKPEGTGYGLPFVRDVIQRLHHGSIDIHPNASSRTTGITFRITLPKTRREARR